MYCMTIFGYFPSLYKCGDAVYIFLNSWMRLFYILFIQNAAHLEVKGQSWLQAATFKCSKSKIQETSLSLLIRAQRKALKKTSLFCFFTLTHSQNQLVVCCFFFLSATFNASHFCDLNAVFMSEMNPLWTLTAVRMSVGRPECQFLHTAVSNKRKKEIKEV